jgi:transposase
MKMAIFWDETACRLLKYVSIFRHKEGQQVVGLLQMSDNAKIHRKTGHGKIREFIHVFFWFL